MAEAFMDAAAMRARLKELYDYDPVAGQFIHRSSRGNGVAGEWAGSINKVNGYRYSTVDGVNYSTHRLVWLWHFGEWPPLQLDHINRCKTDNRLANLRLATTAQNAANKSRPNKSGFKGVYRNAGRWQAQIKAGGRTHCLGSFTDPEAAHRAYVAAAKILHGEFAFDGASE